jgi:hypothetical protein
MFKFYPKILKKMESLGLPPPPPPLLQNIQILLILNQRMQMWWQLLLEVRFSQSTRGQLFKQQQTDPVQQLTGGRPLF